jgi:hypothetical protein
MLRDEETENPEQVCTKIYKASQKLKATFHCLTMSTVFYNAT